MKKLYGFIAAAIVLGTIGFTINWSYVKHLWDMSMAAVQEFPTDKTTASNALTNEVKSLTFKKLINPKLGGSLDDSEDVFDIGNFPDVPKKQIKNLHKTYDQKSFEDAQKEFPNLTVDISAVNDKFKGDNFAEKDSFHYTAVNNDKNLRDLYVKVNVRCTAGYEKNLDGHISNNAEFVDTLLKSKYKDTWEEMKRMDVRKTVAPVTTNTIMQKIIPEEEVVKIINEERANLSGCMSKASDAAPYVYNILSAYVHLRLDFSGNNPYRDPLAKKGNVFVLRCTLKEATLTNQNIPTLDSGYPPPCTETGYVGSPTYLIPEYFKKFDKNDLLLIEEGAIYCLNYEGEETLVAVFDSSAGAAKNGAFIDVSHFIKP